MKIGFHFEIAYGHTYSESLTGTQWDPTIVNRHHFGALPPCALTCHFSPLATSKMFLELHFKEPK